MKKVMIPRAYLPLNDRAMVGKVDFQLLHDGIVATMICGIGFAPIIALALSLMGVFSLPFASLILIVPAIAVGIGLICYDRRYGRLMLHGYLMGIVAVSCYDCVRVPFTMAGWMDDFIPKIGIMLVGDRSHHVITGYLWRYLGNGGGMGMAFVSAFILLRHHFLGPTLMSGLKSGLAFGIFVWTCLIVTLKISPQGENIMFVITPTSLVLSLIGHLVFGWALGWLVNHFYQRVPNGRWDRSSFGCRWRSIAGTLSVYDKPTPVPKVVTTWSSQGKSRQRTKNDRL